MATSEFYPAAKVNYRPLEAAIRWCGLEEHQEHILNSLRGKRLPDPNDFPEWPALRLNTERIYDGITNRELPCGIDGIPIRRLLNFDHPQLTIRHVDLRTWMTRYYPDQRPRFLFSTEEQEAVALTYETLEVLRLEREALKAAIRRRDQELRELRERYNALLKGFTDRERSVVDEALSPRAESTYLHIVGGLLRLLLGRSPSGQPFSSFKTQESVVSAMVAHFGERMGMTERTLHKKFGAANRKMEEP